MNRILRSALAAAAVLTFAAPFSARAQQMTLALDGQSPTITVPKSGVSMDLTAIDKTADPCTDFYAYACGNWRKNNPIPADKTRWGRFDELGEHNLYSIYTLLQQAADKPATPLQTKYGNYFAACMDDSLADRLGAKPIQPALDKIGAWTDKATLSKLLGTLEDQHGIGLFYNFGSEQDQKDSQKQIPAVFQGGLTLPDRDYYLQDDDRMKGIREKYIAHVTKMFTLLGDTPEQAATETQAVMRIETALAKSSLPRVEMRDPANVYHVKTLADLQASTPAYRWADYFSSIRTPVTTLNVATPGYFTAMNAEIQSASVADLKSYMRWHVLHGAAGNLSTPFDQENFAFFNGTLSGQKEQAPRWKRCTQATDRALGEAVGQDWVAKNFTPAAKANMQELVHQLEAALGEDIEGLDWMSPTTRVEAQKKLRAFRDKIGYPETWRDYSSIAVKRDDRVGNAERVAVFNDRRDLAKIGKPVNEKEWGMTPPTVNAYYDPSNNDINFPAGILQPPFYDFKIDPAVNFGAIGVVIGHEMTHGFDDEGSQYDPQGNVRMWWTKEDKAEFDKRTACEVNEYGNFEPVPGQKLNGKLTLGENTADNGGLQVAYVALHKELAKLGPDASKPIDGYTPDQRYFLGFAQVWCENTREQEAVRRIKIDPHSPGRFRTNGAVQNSSKFAEAFSCKQGQPMAPVNACRVW
ncbi:M13 family metallopeptidase [Terriglobus roseus]|uniref:Endothelin-converting enzyme Metallo peptidase. MEROPS family M13 n=1 Tax=Terriglobus roseus TaxID=392734 RepID=A0A1H4QF88_9BACT|nr:M13 family metallopeptidase [Terriglobus roseus]SEC18257.1 endothelin-converting enzyme Metallo peptidase. MEROPS family M13 [Terriglobus roseus]